MLQTIMGVVSLKYNVLTILDGVQFPIYTYVPNTNLGVRPPNIKNVLSVSDVRVKKSQGGGHSPLTIGEIH